ncbi:MAG TPA: response regulator, partial [Gammaproteobacteria bacterium]|nr:response regulator [Gammaproteobacteria bacterium]
KKILLVDDSATMLMSMSAILKKAGYAVETADGGAMALQKVAGYVPDLVITDLNMPGMDGITLIGKLKNQPALRFKPMLILTTESKASKRQEGKAVGATGWLVKPVQPDQLLDVIKKLVPGA